MPRIIPEFDAGNVSLRPTETGIEANAQAARRLGAFSSQAAGAEEMLARETERLGGQTQQLGRETEQLGSFKKQAADQEGRAIGSSIAAAGDAAVAYMDHQQISHGAASYATLLQEATQSWNDTLAKADPNDPTVAPRFMDSLNERLANFQNDGFYTENAQKWAEAHVDALRQHFAEKTISGMSDLAAKAVDVNSRQTMNALSATVYNDPTPSTLGMAIASLASTTEGRISSSPNLGGQAGGVRMELLQKGNEALVKSAAIGYISQHAEMPPWINDPKFAPYVNAVELKQFEQAQKGYQRMAQSEDRAQRQQRDYDDKKDFNAKLDALEASTMPQNAGARPQLPQDYWDKLRTYANHPGAALEPGRLKTMVENGERLTDRLNKPEPIGPISHDTTIQLLNRIRATDQSKLQSNDEIYKAYGDGKLNTADFNFLQKEYQDRKTPEGEALNQDRSAFFKNYAAAISGQGNMYQPSLGDPKVYNAEMDARRMENMLRQKGLDPHLAYDPASEYFLGKPERLAKWQQSMQQDLQTRAQQPAAAPAETPAKSAVPTVPPALRGVAALSHNKDWTLFRDDATGKIYNAQGDEVKR